MKIIYNHRNEYFKMLKECNFFGIFLAFLLISMCFIQTCNYKKSGFFSPLGDIEEPGQLIPSLSELQGQYDITYTYKKNTCNDQSGEFNTSAGFQINPENPNWLDVIFPDAPSAISGPYNEATGNFMGETERKPIGEGYTAQEMWDMDFYPKMDYNGLTAFGGISRVDVYNPDESYNCGIDYNIYGEKTSTELPLPFYSLTVEKEGNGFVGSDGGDISCGNTCVTSFEEGMEVMLTAEPDDGWEFDGWSGDIPDNCTSNSNGCTILMDRIKTVKATFTQEQEKILQTGLFPLGLSNPEYPAYLTGIVDSDSYYNKKSRSRQTDEVSFGAFRGRFITAFSGANGYQVLDLATGEVLQEETGLGGTGPFFGIAGAIQDPPGENSPAMLSLAGANGYVLDRFDQSGPLEFDGTTFDVFPAGGDPVTDVVSYVRPDAGVYFFVFDDSQNLYVPAEVELPVNLFDDKELVSAYVHDDILSNDPVPQPRGSLLVLTREAESGVYLAKWDGSDPVRAIGNIGFDARRIRCIDDGTGSGNLICAASIFGHDRLGLMTWDGENAPVLTDFAEIGDGPVGIDMRLLPSGNIGIVSTGFKDNTVTESVVGTDGRVESNNNRPAPGGCLNPGHAIYIEDDESLKILGTCYSSESYFIVKSEL